MMHARQVYSDMSILAVRTFLPFDFCSGLHVPTCNWNPREGEPSQIPGPWIWYGGRTTYS
jgi:hypothetical protein